MSLMSIYNHFLCAQLLLRSVFAHCDLSFLVMFNKILKNSQREAKKVIPLKIILSISM